MVLIVSDENEHSTDRVIDWLLFYGIQLVRISNKIKINIDKLEISNSKSNEVLIEISVNGSARIVDLKKIDSFWFRRNNFEISHLELQKFNKEITFISNYLAREKFTLKDYIHSSLIEKNNINSIKDRFTNKLYNLELAKKAGLNIPNTLVTTSKIELLKFFNANEGNIIYKSLDIGYLSDKELGIEGSLYTQKVNLNDFEENEDYFFPTFFQKNVDKKYEIRTFYLSGKCYSVAIFSQNDEKTKLDFRHYNYERPNRTPIFILPQKIENSLKSFMESISMNSGSIDLIYTKENNFVFLEVNPVGQYEQVSTPGNYYLDKLIAKSLMNL